VELGTGVGDGLHHVPTVAPGTAQQQHFAPRDGVQHHYLARHPGKRPLVEARQGLSGRLEIQAGQLFGDGEGVSAGNGQGQGGFGDIGSVEANGVGRGLAEAPEASLNVSHAGDHGHVLNPNVPRGFRLRKAFGDHGTQRFALEVDAVTMAQVHQPGTVSLVGVFTHQGPVVPDLGAVRAAVKLYGRLS
jgi:hypothetical protein